LKIDSPPVFVMLPPPFPSFTHFLSVVGGMMIPPPSCGTVLPFVPDPSPFSTHPGTRWRKNGERVYESSKWWWRNTLPTLDLDLFGTGCGDPLGPRFFFLGTCLLFSSDKLVIVMNPSFLTFPPPPNSMASDFFFFLFCPFLMSQVQKIPFY